MEGPATAAYSVEDKVQSDRNEAKEHIVTRRPQFPSNTGESFVFAAVTRAPTSLIVERRRAGLDATTRISAKIDEVLDFARKWGASRTVDFDVVWTKILWTVDIVTQAIEDRGKPGFTRISFPRAFHMAAYSFVTTTSRRAPGGTAKLYREYERLFDVYTKQLVEKAIPEQVDDKPRVFHTRWENYKLFCEWMRRFFEPIDRAHVPGSPRPSLSAIALRAWWRIWSQHIDEKFTARLMSIIRRHRDKGADSECISIVRSLTECLGIVGALDHASFDKIKHFVNHKAAANRGKFVPYTSLPLLEQSTKPEDYENNTVVSTIRLSNNLSPYHEHLENALLEETREYCAMCRSEWLAKRSLPFYIERVQQMLHDEELRVDRSLDATTWPKLKPIIVHQLLKIPQDKLLVMDLPGGCSAHDLVLQRMSTELRLLFDLLKMVEDLFGSPSNKDTVGLAPLAQFFRNSIRTEGMVRIQAHTRQLLRREAEQMKSTKAGAKAENRVRVYPEDFDYIQDVIDHLGAMNRMAQVTFRGHKRFIKVYKFSFDFIINWGFGKVGSHVQRGKRGRYISKSAPKILNRPWDVRTTTAEMLAHYCDMILRGRCYCTGGIKTRLGLNEIETKVESALEMFQFLHNKDIFLDVYQTLLMHRLLERDCNQHSERHAIGLLKISQGINYVRGLEIMFSDLAQSEQLEQSFLPVWATDSHNAKGLPDLHLKMTLLTQSAWPFALHKVDPVRIQMPHNIKCICPVFEHWYRRMHSKRKIFVHWKHSTATLEATFPSLNPDFKTLQLHMSVLQAVLLLAFSRKKLRSGHTLQELAETLGVEWLDNDPMESPGVHMVCALLRTFLKPFKDCRGALLLKGPKRGPPILATDKFKLNPQFQSKKRKILVPLHADLKTNHVHDSGRVLQARPAALEAAIVRIMKARSRMSHHDLVAEVTRQISHFRATARQVNLCIGRLIDREFIMRDDTDKRMYIYLT